MLLRLVTLQVCARTAAALGGPALPPKLRAIEQSLRGAHDAKAAFRTEELFRGCDREQLAPAPATVARGAVPGDLRGAILRNGPNARPWGTVCKSNLQPDFNVRVCECFGTSTAAVLRELAKSNRFVQKSAESTSI